MEAQVVLDERGDEEIAVVVALLKAQLERDPASAARLAEQLRASLDRLADLAERS